MHFTYAIHKCIQNVPEGNVPDFGRMFLKLKYTDITKNIYIQSSTVMEIMAKKSVVSLRFHVLYLTRVTYFPYTAHVCPSVCSRVNAANSLSTVVTVRVNCVEL